jgi:hypothetical protein
MKSLGKHPSGISKRGWEDNIKMYLREMIVRMGGK